MSRTYQLGGQPVHALADVNEEIGEGEHVAIMGTTAASPAGSAGRRWRGRQICLRRREGRIGARLGLVPAECMQ